MRLLSERIRGVTQGRGFSVIYSDIGPEYYAKNGGWESRHAENELIIPSTKSMSDTAAIELLNLTQAEECINEDVKLIKEDLAVSSDSVTIQLVPQQSELEWATLRASQTSKHLKLEDIKVIGAQTTSADGWGYILWCHEYKESSLTVLRLREPSSDAGLRGLIQAALIEAERSGFQKVTVWSASERLEILCGIKTRIREGALPGLLWFTDDKNVHWRNIEKLGWC